MRSQILGLVWKSRTRPVKFAHCVSLDLLNPTGLYIYKTCSQSLKQPNLLFKRCVHAKNAETYFKVGRQNFADLNLHISLCRSAFRSALPNANLSFKDCVQEQLRKTQLSCPWQESNLRGPVIPVQRSNRVTEASFVTRRFDSCQGTDSCVFRSCSWTGLINVYKFHSILSTNNSFQLY
jgi:hypothetical protein